MSSGISLLEDPHACCTKDEYRNVEESQFLDSFDVKGSEETFFAICVDSRDKYLVQVFFQLFRGGVFLNSPTS